MVMDYMYIQVAKQNFSYRAICDYMIDSVSKFFDDLHKIMCSGILKESVHLRY